jgi:nicotinamidase/pyrazinamidase
MKAICFVDCQNDFMDADGALAVPGTDAIRGKLAEIRRFAADRSIQVFFTMDSHDGTEPEMIAQGGPFPPHCIVGTEGEDIIPEVPIVLIPVVPPRTIFHNPPASVFPKRCYDVFDPIMGNSNIEGWLKEKNIDKVYIVGVVGNICVQAAAIGMAKRGIDVTIWDDAVVFMSIDAENNAIKSWEKMAAAGVGFGLFDAMKDTIWPIWQGV